MQDTQNFFHHIATANLLSCALHFVGSKEMTLISGKPGGSSENDTGILIAGFFIIIMAESVGVFNHFPLLKLNPGD